MEGCDKADQDIIVAKRLTNVTIASLPFGEVSFPKPLDLVWITQNYHDLKIAEFGHVDTAAFNRAVFAALKPGGTFFILDHEAPAEIDLAAIAKLHRIEKSQVVRATPTGRLAHKFANRFLHTGGRRGAERRPADDPAKVFDVWVRLNFGDNKVTRVNRAVDTSWTALACVLLTEWVQDGIDIPYHAAWVNYDGSRCIGLRHRQAAVESW